jgi:hypothetical protein
VVASSPVKPS